MEYSFEELADMHLCYGRANGIATEARRIYEELYPNRRLPWSSLFVRLDQRLRDTGSLQVRRSGGYEQRDPGLEERVLRHIEENPSSSTRKIAAIEQVSNNTVWRILKDQQLYPYHYQRVHGLEPRDFERRSHFCTWMLQKIREDPEFTSQILFTDEANFNRYGIINYHNDHEWAEENPHAYRTTNTQRQFATNVWAGILGDKIIGPVIIPDRLTGQAYLHFLQYQLPEILEDVPLQVRRDMWLMHDGAPPHYTAIVRQYLHQNFPNKWIGRGGPVPWPARSPDLNPMDFFFWGHLKNLVYATPITTLDELKNKIKVTSGIIQNEMGDFRNIRRNFNRRMELCLEQNGGYIEHLL